MRPLWTATRIGILDMRGDLRRFLLLVVCLAVGTALIAGVNSVGASITRTIDDTSAQLMGGDVELSRADRPATNAELAKMGEFGIASSVIDSNLRAESNTGEVFVDLSAAGLSYPLLGTVTSPQLTGETALSDLLEIRDGIPGALVSPVMLDQLGLSIGDTFYLGGTEFAARGSLNSLPDGPVRGFRLGLTTLISDIGFSGISDRTSPLPGLGIWYRYKLLLNDRNAEAGKAALEQTFADKGWTVRSARDGLGPMMRYYDLFMRFLIIVGLGSLLIGGVSVWTGMRAYIAERASVIAILRSMGADRARIFIHFFSQVTALALVGVGTGLCIGSSGAYIVLPTVGHAIGIELTSTFHLQPLLVAGCTGLLTAFAFAYLPLQHAQTIQPVLLFRSRGLSTPPIDWKALLCSAQIVPLVLAGTVFFILACLMTNDALLVLTFGLASAIAAMLIQLFTRSVQFLLRHMPEPRPTMLRHALRAISGAGANTAAIVVSAGLALAMLIVVLVLQTNLQQEYLGASAFDAPTLVGSDLFADEVEQLATMAEEDQAIIRFIATPMLRGALTEIAGQPASSVRTRGPEATFLLSGEIPLTYRSALPPSSRVTAGQWWPADYSGPGLVSLHQSLRSGLGVDLGDTLTFNIFGDPITVTITSFRDYSWQGGIDFLATFSPGVIEHYPTTLFTAVTAASGQETTIERRIATEFTDVKFIAIGDTLRQVTDALGQLSFAAMLVGGLAVGNGLLVMIGSLATGRRQHEADTVITRVLGATRFTLLGTAFLQYLILAVLAAIPACIIGVGIGWLISLVMLDVEFSFNIDILGVVFAMAIIITALLGAMTILRAASARPAHLLRDL